jgi:hypothetical protein
MKHLSSRHGGFSLKGSVEVQVYCTLAMKDEQELKKEGFSCYPIISFT